MVNTRILQQRLGWRAPGDGTEAQPPAAAAVHRPILQGRIDPGTRGPLARPARAAAMEELWESLPEAGLDLRQMSRGRASPGFDRDSAAGAAMDQLRGQILRVLKDKGWRRVGITSAGRGAGRSFVAAALAASIARLESLRVLLVDTDLEAPGLSALLGIPALGGLDDVLSGLTPPLSRVLRVGPSLALALNDTPVPEATERMMTPDAILALRALVDGLGPDVVIHDLPPLVGHTLTQALLPQLDAVLLVADGTRTTAADILACERLLEGQVPMLGVILNKSEDRDPRIAARRR
jgi:protein-tyrosine kinase